MKTSSSLVVAVLLTQITVAVAQLDSKVTSPASGKSIEVEIFDRLGQKFAKEELLVKSMRAGTPPPCNAGRFLLQYEDTTSGFADPILGAARRDVLCRVFEDLSALLVPGTGGSAQVQLAVRPSGVNMPPSALGVASSYYLLFAAGSGMVDGEVWKTFQTGIDSYTDLSAVGLDPGTFYHGYVQINFAHTYNTSLTGTAGAGEFDLYSVILHEAIHALGFGSMIGGDGTSKLAGGSPGAYSRFDLHLETANSNPLITAPDLLNTSFAASTLDLVAGCNGGSPTIEFLSNFTSPQPIYNRSPFAGGTSLSHLDHQCPASAPYVMRPGFAMGESARVPSPQERHLLCDLGYEVTNVYGTVPGSPSYLLYSGTCGFRVAGVNDLRNSANQLYTGKAGDGLLLRINDILGNDENATSIAELRILTGGGSLDQTAPLATDFTYTPAVAGLAILQYVPEGPGGITGNNTHIFIDVAAADLPPCDPSDCQMACYGDFEAITDPFVAPLNDFHVTSGGNSPDLYSSNQNVIIGCAGHQSGLAQEGQNFAGAAGFGGNREGVFFTLKRSMREGVSYRLSFQARAAVAGCPVTLPVRISENRPCEPPTLLANCSSFVPVVVGSHTVASDAWSYYSFDYAVPNGSEFNYLTLYPNANSAYVYLDDVRVEEIGAPALDLTATVDSDRPCPGDAVEYTFTVCDQGSTPTAPVEISAELPPGIVREGGDFAPDLTATIQPSDFVSGCAVKTLSARVLPNAALGIPLTARVVVELGGCTSASAGSAVDLVVERQRLVVTTTADRERVQIGDDVTYTVEVCNEQFLPLDDVSLELPVPADMSVTNPAGMTPSGSMLVAGPFDLAAASFGGGPACVTYEPVLRVDALPTCNIEVCATGTAGSADCASQTDCATVSLHAGTIGVVKAVLSDSVDDDGFADTCETVEMRLLLRNNTGATLNGINVLIAGNDPKIEWIDNTIVSVPGSLAPGATVLTPAFVFYVADVDRTTVDEEFSVDFAITTVAAPDCALLPTPQFVTLDLDLDASAGGAQATSFFESFEFGLGQFEIDNIDFGRQSLADSDGYRCQYNDPDWINSNTYDSYAAPDCYLGLSQVHTEAAWWDVDGLISPSGGRAYSGAQSLRYGVDLSGGSHTTPQAVLEAVRTTAPINVGAGSVCEITRHVPCQNDLDCEPPTCPSCQQGESCVPVCPTLTFKHQASLLDGRTVNSGEFSMDRGVVMAQYADLAGNPSGDWFRLEPYVNGYDTQAADFFFDCQFDPVDDGTSEDDFFDNSAGDRRLGPSSTCYPEFCFSHIGDTDASYDPEETGKAFGPGLAGSVGPGTWIETKVDLSRFVGRRLRLRFLSSAGKRAGSAPGAALWPDVFNFGDLPGEDGWWIDDVEVSDLLDNPATLSVDDSDNSAECIDPTSGRVLFTALAIQQDGRLSLSWTPSCSPFDTDYGVYQGVDFTAPDHFPRTCTTGGATSTDFPMPPEPFVYFLIVPNSPATEGSHGRLSSGHERPRGISACAPQAIGC